MQKVYRNGENIKKFIHSVVALLIVACMFVELSAPMHAADITNSINSYYVGLTNVSCGVDITSGKATCEGYSYLRSGYSASLTLKLQQSKDGSSWSTLKAWTATGTSIRRSYYVSSGYKYRVIFNVKVYNSSGMLVDNLTKTSATKPY